MKRTLLIALLALATIPAIAQQTHTFSTEAGYFTLDGKPFKVLSGEVHYARIPREYWHARLKMARAMGLNTIATYVFWNVHEPTSNHYDFTGQYDVAAFIKAAQEEGLYVILRAGPYSCAEWEFGGLPAWLLADPAIATTLRSNNPAFMVPTERWIRRLAQEVAPLQISRGGPILMTQVENEYGNFGSDHAYMQHLQEIFKSAGFTGSLLYSADNWRNIPNGSIPGLLAAVNFGIGNHQGGMDALAKLRPDAPLFVSEYWPGWFDSWGHPHETRPIPPQLEDLDYILHRGAGINIYMFHGGTSFGFMSGAGSNKSGYRPTVTSYDYDAPLDESGRPTPKFYAYRKVLAQFAGCPTSGPSNAGLGAGKDVSSQPKAAHFAVAAEKPVFAVASSLSTNKEVSSRPERSGVEGPAAASASMHPEASASDLSPTQAEGALTPGVCPFSNCSQTQSSDEPLQETSNESCLPPVPETPPVITIPQITLTESTPLWANLPTPIPSEDPQPMEHFGQSYGYILYRTNLPAAVTGDLILDQLHDYAQIYLNGNLAGTLDRRHLQNTFPLTVTGPARLDILVANDGRINSTKLMHGESKGITHAVTLAGHPITNWQVYPLPMTNLPKKFVTLSGAKTPRISPEGPQISPQQSQAFPPSFYRSHFTLTQTGDTFLDIRDLGKGALWINGHPIGRFSNIGPQQTLYVPAPWLQKGTNEIIIFDLIPSATLPHVTGLDHPILDGPVSDQTTSPQQ
jgi:Glycosyl hydrolases family 35